MFNMHLVVFFRSGGFERLAGRYAGNRWRSVHACSVAIVWAISENDPGGRIRAIRGLELRKLRNGNFTVLRGGGDVFGVMCTLRAQCWYADPVEPMDTHVLACTSAVGIEICHGRTLLKSQALHFHAPRRLFCMPESLADHYVSCSPGVTWTFELYLRRQIHAEVEVQKVDSSGVKRAIPESRQLRLVGVGHQFEKNSVRLWRATSQARGYSKFQRVPHEIWQVRDSSHTFAVRAEVVPFQAGGLAEMLGANDDVQQRVYCAEECVLSTGWEGSLHALLEAMAAGLQGLITTFHAADDSFHVGCSRLISMAISAADQTYVMAMLGFGPKLRFRIDRGTFLKDPYGIHDCVEDHSGQKAVARK